MENKFEEKLKTLEEYINKLNTESLGLQESIKLYESAKALADDLKKELDEASIKVARIIKDDEEKEFTPDGL